MNAAEHLGITQVRLPSGAEIGVREREVRRRPFARLIRLQREGATSGRKILVAMPLSGHRPVLLRDMVVGLLASADVYVVAWTDAGDVPLAKGTFGLADNIEYLMDFIRWMGPDTHVIALSQSPLPTLAATALLADGYGAAAEPASLTLLSGFLDPRINPTRVGMLLSGMPTRLFRSLMLKRVPCGRPGCGRLVYPAVVQRASLAMYLRRHLASMGELWFKTFVDDGDPTGAPFLVLYFSLIDLSGGLVVDMLQTAFHDHALPRGAFSWRGQRLRPDAISRCGLMTVEGGCDDVSGIGQTYVAHCLCSRIPENRRDHLVEPGIGHFGAFHGRVWRERILPRVMSFIRLCEGRLPSQTTESPTAPLLRPHFHGGESESGKHQRITTPRHRQG